MRSRFGKTKILPASATDLRTLVENYVYPLMVCQEDGMILFYNGAAQAALGQDELLGRPLPENWAQADELVEIETADEGARSFELIWQDILWDGNVAWYLVAVPAHSENGATPEQRAEAGELRDKLEESQGTAALKAEELQAELEQSREMAAAEAESLRAKLERAQEQAAEADELRRRLEEAEAKASEAERLREELEEVSSKAVQVELLRSKLEETEQTAAEAESLRQKIEESDALQEELERLREQLHETEQVAGQVDELRFKLEQAEASEDEADELRSKLEQSVEMVAVEVERREAAETERERLEAKLRDLHQRSLSKLESARSALEKERSERDALFERLSELKQESEVLRGQLEEKTVEAEEVRHQSTEHFEDMKRELLSKVESLNSKEEELSETKRDLIATEQKLTAKNEEIQQKVRELAAAEERAERYKAEYEELDREMIKAQEESALLNAKLQSAESRMERYQRLMERQPNEFSRGTDAEMELEKLQARIEELEVELAATTAATRGLGGEQPPEGNETVAQLQAQCEELRDKVSERQRKIDELQLAISNNGTGSGSVPASVVRELEQTKEVVEELRFHRGLEYQEACESLKQLQQRFATLQVDGEDSEAGPAPEELAELQEALYGANEELKVLRKMNESVPDLNNRIAELEAQLETADGSVSDEQMQAAAEQALNRVKELEMELQRARQEASPEELTLARRRIADLEARVADQPQVPQGDGQLIERNRQLETELGKTREQLQELNSELRRTLEGDRETKKLAYADQLTGLPNLNLTGQYLQVCFERSGRGEGALALILIDLDHFRRVNDALGQKAGDELLKQVGARLQRTVTEKDTAIARRGEDEFMVVAFMENARVGGEALTARIRGIAHNLLNELARPFDIKDQKVQVTASLGVALYPGPASSRTELLEQSEHAMYKAKETGRARVSFYTEDMHNHRERRKFLENELRTGLAQGQFNMIYQPIYDLTTSKPVGVEALLRWNHPTRGVLEPADFLEVAEDTGLIVPIGEASIQEALGIAKQKFMKRKFLSINLSFRQLIDSGFSQRFMKHLQLAGIKPHEVIVEVSEKATRIDPDRIKNTLAHLAHWGVGIALDDFGTGSSELTHLTELNLRVLKIDQSIISRIPDDRSACKLTHAITQMSQALEIPVLAEGVESREQLSQIGSYGCKYAQGLILNAPMNVSQLIQVL